MKLHRLASLPLVALALGLVVLSGCSPTPEPTPTPTAVFASEEEAFAAAEETYRAYIDASNSVDLADPQTFDALNQYTAGRYLSEERKALSHMHAEGYVSEGAIRIEWFRNVSWVEGTTLTAMSCNNVSETSLTDRDGTSLVPADRPIRYALRLELTLVRDALRIVKSDAIEDADCLPR